MQTFTIDTEGRIQAADAAAAALLGYKCDELIGQRRVAELLPGLVVINSMGNWLSRAREQASITVTTPLKHANGSMFSAELLIEQQEGTSGQETFLCSISVLDDVDPDEILPIASFGLRLRTWLHITRAPFLTATAVPMLLAGAWVWSTQPGQTFNWLRFALAMVALLALHVAANTFNDYFDWARGTDQANNDAFQPFSGGSRAVGLGLISQRGMFTVALGASLLAAAVGGVLVWYSGPLLLVFGAAGLALGYTYTAPPVRPVARRGLGELAIFLAFGPLLTAGAVAALTGVVGWTDALLGIPLGLLTTAILWINQFPDAAGDAATGKNHLVVTLGRSNARWGYIALLTTALGAVIVAVAVGMITPWALLGLLSLPLAVYSSIVLIRHWRDRSLVRANAAAIQLQLVCGLGLIIGLVLGRVTGG